MKSITHNSSSSTCSSDTNMYEEQAKEFFAQGIEYEKIGKFYEAIRFYKKAVQLVPDIEFKIHELSKTSAKSVSKKVVETETGTTTSVIHNDHEDLSNVDLFERFQESISTNGTLIEKSNSDAGVISTQKHISCLSVEVIFYIFRWVVSSHLDVRSLEQCAAVCKGFYLCARDERIWKLACNKVWGKNTGQLKNSIYKTWRQMFIERCRLNFNGCYISKTSYKRCGEKSFQKVYFKDQFYRGLHLVEYYRYLRFFPNGTALMMTSSEEPVQGVTKLNNIQSSRNEVLKGYYHLNGDSVVVVVNRTQNSKEFNNDSTCTFYMDFKISSSTKRHFCKLQWKSYSITQTKKNVKICNEIKLNKKKYPPLWFSIVKSYHLEADYILK